MSDDLTTLAADLRALHDRWGEAVARTALTERTASLSRDQRRHLALLVFGTESHLNDSTRQTIDKHTTVEVSDHARVAQAIGLNYGVVQAFFGSSPPPDGELLLRRYLDTLCERYRPLALGRLLTRERNGDERASAPPLPLRAVYTALSTDTRLPRERFDLSLEELKQAVDMADPDQFAPDQLRFPVADLDNPHTFSAMLLADHADAQVRSLREFYNNLRQVTQRAFDSGKRKRVTGQWYEPELAVEAIAPARARIVLLGDPGSGKSTVLRYLVVCIAEALLDGATTGPTDLRGWNTQPLPTPIFCSLGAVAKALDNDPSHDLERLESAILRSVYREGSPLEGMRERLFQVWNSGSVLLCFDGLDEVSSTPETTCVGVHSRRERLAIVLHQLSHEMGNARMVVTCRTRPYEQDQAWQLPNPWQVRRLEPFALGQVRFFVEQWYTQSCSIPGAKFSLSGGAVKAAELLRAIPFKPGLRDVCQSPLLLTMVALLHYNQKQLPDERAEVYEELVSLLLDRWEWVRSNEREQSRLASFGERLGLATLRARDLRAAINEVAYKAHCITEDGRGIIPENTVYELLESHFRIAIDPEHPERVKKSVWTVKVETFLELLVEESGLIQPDADGNYTLPHLTFEEYLAACYLAEQQYTGLMSAYDRWAKGGDRWREPALLLMGCLRRENKHAETKHWLDMLLDPVNGATEKTHTQLQRDAVLAAACAADLGGRGYLLKHYHATKVQAFETHLRAALVDLIEQPTPTNLLPLRLEAGYALGRLGDPRYPVELSMWIHELARRNEVFQSSGDHYLRYVPGGIYHIGGWEDGQPTATIALQPFWIARFSITVAQYEPFVEVGYTPTAERWWLPGSWTWKQERAWLQPQYCHNPRYTTSNQPVVEVTWHEATAYCAWLSECLAEQLPLGYVIRLPSEAEWETAASYAPNTLRRPYPWGRSMPTSEHAIYNVTQVRAPAPVGCCPAGKAACGALDMAGNMWEITASDYRTYPHGSHTPQKDSTVGHVPWRGGSWAKPGAFVRCNARGRSYVYVYDGNLGFRIVVAPALVDSLE